MTEYCERCGGSTECDGVTRNPCFDCMIQLSNLEQEALRERYDKKHKIGRYAKWV